jgi:cytochrome P450
VLASAFAAKYLEDWEYKVTDKVNRLVQRFDQHLAQSPDTPLDYRSWTNLFTIDSLCDICLSEQLACIDRGTDTVIAEDLAGHTKEVPFRDCLYATFHVVGDLVWSYEWYYVVSWIAQRVSAQYASLFQLAKGWSQLVHHLTKRRWERYVHDEPVSDVFAALMEDPTGNPQDLEWGEVLAEISLAISGSSSTSNSIASTMQLLIENPDKMRKLQEEVDSAMSTQLEDRPDGNAAIMASYDQIKSLPYLRAVIDESLRLYPPISHGLPRETPKEGMMIMDQWVAGNTTVSVSAYVAHRDPTVFDQPESFMPERWLGEQGRALQSHFIAFSAGARGCIGRPISYLQASILLASLVHRYDFEMWDSPWKLSRRETMNLIMGPMPVRIKKRST